MKILIFLGSVRQPSLTRVLARYASLSMERAGLAIEWVDLRAQPLPIADPDYHHCAAETPNEAVRDLVRRTNSADGIVLASPLYHGSYSGVLKNALDSLSYDAFRDKPVGLLAHGSGAKRCSQPAEHLVPIVRTLYGHTLQCQVASSKSDFAGDHENGEPILVDDDVKTRCDRLALEMLGYLKMQEGLR